MSRQGIGKDVLLLQRLPEQVNGNSYRQMLHKATECSVGYRC